MPTHVHRLSVSVCAQHDAPLLFTSLMPVCYHAHTLGATQLSQTPVNAGTHSFLVGEALWDL